MTAFEEMSCQELVELITNYLEDYLPAPARARFERHLSGCTGCHNYLNQMRITLKAVGRLSQESIPEPARARLLQTFRLWKAGG